MDDLLESSNGGSSTSSGHQRGAPPSLLLYLIPPLPPLRLALAVLALTLLLLLRVWSILPARKGRISTTAKATSDPKGLGTEQTQTVGVFLGSGGHTTELLQLVSALPTKRYIQRIYLVSSGDRFSLDKAKDLERKLGSTPPSKQPKAHLRK